MERLIQILREEVEQYAAGGRGFNIRLFPLLDDERHVYAVNAVDYPVRNAIAAGVVVLARIAGDKIVIEEDATDKPLVDALLARGIARESIVLAYKGEPIPDPELFELIPS
jgi:hypothetical protein